MGRPPCCDKSNVKRGLWTAEEDAKILAYVSTHGTGNWTSVPKKAGLKRCGKSCRLRWTNYLRPDLKHESFTPQEEEMIVTLHATIGSRWSLIAAQLPGRTDNDVKNYWNTKLRKKLCDMGIDPVTHKPISQILADYGSIGLPRPSIISSSISNNNSNYHPSNTARISCLNRDLRNAFMSKPAPPQFPSHFSMATTMTTTTAQDSQPQPTYDLLAQLHAIKLVTDPSNCTHHEILQPPHFFNGGSSSSAASITIHPSNIQTDAPLPFPSQPSQLQSSTSTPSFSSSFSWSEFLSEDAFLSPNQEEDLHTLSSTDSSSNPPLEFMGCENDKSANAGDSAPVLHGCTDEEAMRGGPSADIAFGASSGNSFVDAILDRDSQMLWEFPDILDDP